MAILSTLPDGAKVLDLEAQRVARAETRAAQGLGAPFVKLDAGFIAVKAEIPLEAAYLFSENEVKKGLALLLADPTDIDVLWPTLSDSDFEALVNFVSGKTPGESLA